MMLHGYIDRVLQSWQGSGGNSPSVWMQPATSESPLLEQLQHCQHSYLSMIAAAKEI
jgi:hypothetical protein